MPEVTYGIDLVDIDDPEEAVLRALEVIVSGLSLDFTVTSDDGTTRAVNLLDPKYSARVRAIYSEAWNGGENDDA